jgi:hypothetical protein
MTDLLPDERRIPVRAERYRTIANEVDAWPTSWHDGLVNAESLCRADVFQVADVWRRGDARSRELLVATLVWGYGPVGYGPTRLGRVLATSDLDGRLDRALAPIRADVPDRQDLLMAYRLLRDPTQSKLDSLGPAFFTKLLYFAGYRRGVGGVQPLILDSVIASCLPSDLPIRRPSRGVALWRSDEWLAYLDWVAVDGREPDAVEMAMFEQARNASR